MKSPDAVDRGFVRASVIVALTTTLLFIVWCVVDLVYVRLPSGREAVRATEGILIAVACLGVFLAHWKLHRGKSPGLMALITSLLALALATLLILWLGVPFHFWIGGGL